MNRHNIDYIFRFAYGVDQNREKKKNPYRFMGSSCFRRSYKKMILGVDWTVYQGNSIHL